MTMPRFAHPFSALVALVVLASWPPPLHSQQPTPPQALHERGRGIEAAPPDVLAALAESCDLVRHGDALVGRGRDYRAHFTTGGLQFVPKLGSHEPITQQLDLTPIRVGRTEVGAATLMRGTEPVARGLAAVFPRGEGISERYDVQRDGLELSWHFTRPPLGVGDLVVRYAVAGTLGAPEPDGDGLCFRSSTGNGVRIGGVTGIDAQGVRCAGTTRWVDGQVELSLPASFVDGAVYPIVLDPTIGTILTITSTSVATRDEVDVAYSGEHDVYLVVWRDIWSATSSNISGQLVSGSGTTIGSQLSFGGGFFGSYTTGRARTAYSTTEQRFLIVWTEDIGTTAQVWVQAMVADPMSPTSRDNVLITSSTTPGQFRDADIGCETAAPAGQSRGGVVVYQDGTSIRSCRVWYSPQSVLTASTPNMILAGQPLVYGYSAPAIARTASADGKLLAVARKHPLLGADEIIGIGLRTFAVLGGPPTFVLATANSGETLTVPDVDGFSGRWIAVWQRSGSSPNAVVAAPVVWSGATPVAGAGVTLAGPLLSFSAPTIGYAPSKSWLGCRRSSVPSGTTLNVIGIDSATCTLGNDTFQVPTTGGTGRIVTVTATAGGDPGSDDALAVWSLAGSVFAQRLVGTGNGGVVQNLGGGCGTQRGVLSFPTNPAIGTNAFRCTISSLTPFSLTLFNFSAPGAPLACGSCAWTPFQITQLFNAPLGSATMAFPIPYAQGLIGLDFETQWTTLHPTSSPCSLVPNVVLSDRTRLVIGQ